MKQKERQWPEALRSLIVPVPTLPAVAVVLHRCCCCCCWCWCCCLVQEKVDMPLFEASPLSLARLHFRPCTLIHASKIIIMVVMRMSIHNRTCNNMHHGICKNRATQICIYTRICICIYRHFHDWHTSNDPVGVRHSHGLHATAHFLAASKSAGSDRHSWLVAEMHRIPDHGHALLIARSGWTSLVAIDDVPLSVEEALARLDWPVESSSKKSTSDTFHDKWFSWTTRTAAASCLHRTHNHHLSPSNMDDRMQETSAGFTEYHFWPIRWTKYSRLQSDWSKSTTCDADIVEVPSRQLWLNSSWPTLWFDGTSASIDGQGNGVNDEDDGDEEEEDARGGRARPLLWQCCRRKAFSERRTWFYIRRTITQRSYI